MLVLSRKAGESVCIDGEIKITVLSLRSNRVRIGFEAPSDVDIVRSELIEWSSVPSDLATAETSETPLWDDDVSQKELTYSI